MSTSLVRFGSSGDWRTLETSQWLPRRRDEVFPFFSDPRNLESLTPPMLRFESRTLALNLTTCFHLLRAAVRIFPPDGGSIVFVASAAALVGLANHEAIAAAKGGVIGLCLAAAALYASRGIRVNCVAPGLTRTPLTARITGSEASMRATTAMHALGRIGEAEEVASGLAWLLDPEQGWVTGQVIGIDGGLARVRPKA